MTQLIFEFENVPAIKSWALVQNFIYALQEIESGQWYGDSSHYLRITGASDVLCCLGTDESRAMFLFASRAGSFLRKHKKGDVYPPWVIGALLAYGLRFSVGACEGVV